MKIYKDTFSWTNPALEVRAILGKESEHGVFARNEILRSATVAIFGGYVMSIAEEHRLPLSIRDNGVQISDELVLGIKKESEIEISCFFNHSCNPNAGFRGQVRLIAMRDIQCNEQVTFDYGMVLCQPKKNGVRYQFDCWCGEAECRKSISMNDWKMKRLQEKYRGFFQSYLEEKIKKYEKTEVI